MKIKSYLDEESILKIKENFSQHVEDCLSIFDEIGKFHQKDLDAMKKMRIKSIMLYYYSSVVESVLRSKGYDHENEFFTYLPIFFLKEIERLEKIKNSNENFSIELKRNVLYL